MIKNISDNLSRIEPAVLGAGSSYYLKNRFIKKQEKENERKEPLDKFERGFSANPYEDREDEKNEIQLYFSEKYSKLNSRVQNILSKFSKNGEIKTFTDEYTLFAGALISRYLYDKSLPSSLNKKYFIDEENNKKVLTVENLSDDSVIKIQFSNSQLDEINVFDGKYDYLISFNKQNIFDKLLSSKNPSLRHFEKKMNQEPIYSVDYSKNGSCEKYTSYINNKKHEELVFDTSDYSKMHSDSKLYPSSFITYDDNENRLEMLNYAYLRPSEYKEFNPETSKLLKSFKLQGLNSRVYKYSFYNPFDGTPVLNGVLN